MVAVWLDIDVDVDGWSLGEVTLEEGGMLTCGVLRSV